MNRFIKIILVLIIILNLNSCKGKFDDNYPKTVSQLDGFWSTNSLYEIEIDNFNKFPDTIQYLTKNYLTERIGNKKFEKSKFTYGYIASNEPLNDSSKANFIDTLLYEKDSEKNKGLDTKYNYPVYSIGYEYSDLKIGIEKFDLALIIDNNGKILKHINFPKLNSVDQNFIPLDSIHNILAKRKISSRNLKLVLRFDKKSQKTFYYARTFIKKGSITGPSCFPEHKEHFKINAITGKIEEFNSKNTTEYFDN